MIRIPIRYTLIEDSDLADRGTLFQVLNEAEISLLRCFMTLLLLPADAGAMIVQQPPFFEAITRLRRLPTFRKADARRDPPPVMWEAMISEPLLVLMVGDTLPVWLESLLADREIAVLTPSPKVAAALGSVPRVFVGLLQGMEDIREAYRVTRELFAAVAANQRYEPSIRSACNVLAQTDLFTSRPRLDFVPPFPLPQPSEGRSAAYLLNRLSNNVDEPSLASEAPQGGVSIFPHILDWSARACEALSLVETGQQFPPHLPLTKTEVEEYHARLSGNQETGERKFDTLLELGRQLSTEKAPGHPLLAIPVPRLDLARGKAPKSMRLDPRHKESAREILLAVKDVIQQEERPAFGTKKAQRVYSHARDRVMSEQRLIACQTAWLAGVTGSIPIQLHLLPGQLYNALNALSNALNARNVNNPKIPELFQGVELLLSEVLPKGLSEQLDQGNSPVTIFSDLPFEWSLVDEWPLCMTRQVSRIPIGFSHWDMLAAALERPVAIDIGRPERVLVFDLIEPHDAIRSHSDSFITVSNALGQHYTYSSPRQAEDFRAALSRTDTDVVVLDTHGKYDPASDNLAISLRGKWISIHDLLPASVVPPVWILSACHTSVTGAIRGCLVRELLGRGAVCVIATLSRVDAFTASMFVGRLLTNIYDPTMRQSYTALDELFFKTQLTTALLYDPLLPLLRRAEKDSGLKKQLGRIFGDFFGWTGYADLEVREYRDKVAWTLWEILQRHGLSKIQNEIRQAGLIRPETLLFTAFGAPGHVGLEDSRLTRTERQQPES